MKRVEIELSDQTVTMRGPKVMEWKEYREAVSKLSGLSEADVTSGAADAMTDEAVLKVIAKLAGLELDALNELDLGDYVLLLEGLVEVSPDFSDKTTS